MLNKKFPIFQSTLPARGATYAKNPVKTLRVFQSTLPARGATSADGVQHRYGAYFNPRSPHGERLANNYTAVALRLISIHAPRTGSDVNYWQIMTDPQNFNPRSPHGERQFPLNPCGSLLYFNPRSPHGERHEIPVRVRVPPSISIHAPRTGSDQIFRRASS